ncbi:carbon monoxide dehydrogenase subunit G [Modestobacter muralis]|uniref:Carbon monoxide dehydrogenase subunit G n=1 Tax=Modestobacter muralis TaxID=1608614 RepID=A0A6P0ESH1_9ACTN|nr:carbon monoxide dehydrogenase subunit G [Modestobacter muralis]NEN49671.1 carbon monoxide dehydrogenase subunit G [Modestobacter muralis]
MNLDGSAVLSAPPEDVWSVITDPAVLARTIPGCLSLDQVGEDSYTMSVSAGVGAIRGTYAGEVRLAEMNRPSSYVMHASGSGGPGSVRATVQIGLAPSGEGTELTWSADAVVGGAVAGVGQRMISGVAKRMAGQFFSAIDGELTNPPEAEAPSAVASAAAVSSTSVDGQSAEPASSPSAPPARRAAPARPVAGSGGWVPGEARPLLVGVAGGGLLTLLGVWVGSRLGRGR